VKELLKALEAFKESSGSELFIKHRQELLDRGLIVYSPQVRVDEKGRVLPGDKITEKGYGFLDNAKFWPKFRKAMFGSAGVIATHVLAYCLGVATAKFLGLGP